jgi:hypothetical protein
MRVFENFEHRVRSRMFGPKRRRRVPGEEEELRNLYALTNIVRMIKSGRMRLAGHVAGIRD